MTSFDVDDDRHFRNIYEDFNSDKLYELANFITKNAKTTAASMIEKLKSTEKKSWGHSNDISMYTGVAGIAYSYYHYGVILKDIQYINEAQRILEKYCERSKGKKEITFITGVAGSLALKIVLYSQKFDFGEQEKSTEKAEAAVSKLKALSKYVLDKDSGVPDELLYGRAGYLHALLFVNKNTPSKMIEDDLIEKVISTIIYSGEQYSYAQYKNEERRPPLMYAWHDKKYLGGAHGLAGILYTLLQAREYLSTSNLNSVESSLKYLLKLRYESKNFPSSIGSNSDRLVHWCHGAPSMTMLFSLASQIFQNPEYLQIALDCGNVVWMRGLLKKGYGLCHGVSGNAYTFLCLYQLTKDEMHLYRAFRFGEWIIKREKETKIREPDRPLSLFEGLAGQLYFLTDLLDPMSAKFPGYTL